MAIVIAVALAVIPAAAQEAVRARAYEVPDGNTVIAGTENSVYVTIRLHGALAPKAPSYGTPGQPGWRSARQALRKAVGGKNLDVVVVGR